MESYNIKNTSDKNRELFNKDFRIYFIYQCSCWNIIINRIKQIENCLTKTYL